ncbi:hypothetical protein ACFV5E_43125 [Streptomyces chartreusis]|uniref:hypothetical protein n=1 Tax=Streptomyces chartreusis TaxID=1969 RepID=UPI0036A6AC83
MLLFIARIGSWGRARELRELYDQEPRPQEPGEKKSRARGAAYAAANVGTLHQHDGGPSAEYLQPADPSGWGVDAAPDMRTASALIGARIEQCAPCQGSLTAKLLDEEPIVLAVTAAAVYALHSADDSELGGLTSKAAQAFAILLHQTREQAEPELLPWGVSLMSRADRAALLEDTLDLWAHYGPQPSERASQGRGADLLGLDHLATYGVPTTMTPKETTMNERLEDHAESAARSLVELVNALHRQGIESPSASSRTACRRCAPRSTCSPTIGPDPSRRRSGGSPSPPPRRRISQAGSPTRWARPTPRSATSRTRRRPKSRSQ